MTQEEYKTQLEMLWDDYNIMSRSYYFANKPEMKADFWAMRDAQRVKLNELMKSYWHTAISQPKEQSKKLTKEAIAKEQPGLAIAPQGRTRSANFIMITAHGRTQSLIDWAKETGLNRQTIYYRIFKLGWTPEQSISPVMYVKPKGSKARGERRAPYKNQVTITAFGKTQSLIKWCEDYNMNRATLYSRIYHLNWKPEDALIAPVRARYEPKTSYGKKS